MRSNIRGILVFLLAFLIGTTAVLPPLPEVPEIPTLSGPFPIGETVSCKFKAPPAPERPTTSSFTIDIRRRNADSTLEERSIAVKPSGPRVTNLDLEFGEAIENELIVLRSPVEQTFKVEMQFENSMAIGDEGPHLDLLNWKHHTSPWKEIRPTSANTFPVPEVSGADFTRFPTVTTDEIVAAVRKAGGGKRWLDLARTCTAPGVGWCYVTTSRISIRISTKQTGRWRSVHTLNFSVPMVC